MPCDAIRPFECQLVNGPSTPPTIAVGAAMPSTLYWSRPGAGTELSNVVVEEHHWARPRAFVSLTSLVPTGQIRFVVAQLATTTTRTKRVHLIAGARYRVARSGPAASCWDPLSWGLLVRPGIGVKGRTPTPSETGAVNRDLVPLIETPPSWTSSGIGLFRWRARQVLNRPAPMTCVASRDHSRRCLLAPAHGATQTCPTSTGACPHSSQRYVDLLLDRVSIPAGSALREPQNSATNR